MTILVTGAAGFIGSALVNRLLEFPELSKIINVDNFDPFYDLGIKEERVAQHIKNGKERYKLIRTDIADRDSLFTDLENEKIDLIVHLAAKAGVRPSIMSPNEYVKTNILGTQNILDLAKLKDVKKIVFASSSSVYGNNTNIPWKEDDLDLTPISPYAATKLSGEKLCQTYAHLYGMNILALRFFTVYGPGQRPDLAIHKFFKLVSENKSIPFFGDGSTKRDYTYIDDTVSGIVGAIKYSGSGFEIFNLGNRNTVSLHELVNAIENVSKQNVILDRLPMQPGDVELTYASIDKAKDHLGYSPSTKLEDGLTKFNEWFKNLSLATHSH